MNRLIELQPAYLLHGKPFRDTSLIIDFLTRDFGRISAVARGIRRPKSRNKGLLQPFTPLLVSLSGKSDLKTLGSIELRGSAHILKADSLFAGMYLNELMVRLIYSQEVEAELFFEYEKVLQALSQATELEPILRKFELILLDVLGYGINFLQEAESGEDIKAVNWYYFHHESGFHFLHDTGQVDKSAYFQGSELINIAQGNYSSKQTRIVAKHILRHVLGLHLGDKPLKSRQLFSVRNINNE